jgi:cytochrome c553
MARISIYFSLFLFLMSACGNDLPEAVEIAYQSLPEQIDFNLHVKPILSDRCYACHGPDKNARKAKLGLHTEATAFAALESGGGYAFVSGKPHKSQALQRMISDDPEVIMPPPESNLSLTPKEIATIAKWIEQGAEWKRHWAFIPPERPVLSADEAAANTKNSIDYFVQRKLSNEGLQMSPPAEKERLLRRVTRDLTGLPPTIAEIEAFLADTSPDAYEQVVDRLLASKAYGERMAMEWLDVARYADSHGMHADGWRMMWPWRDWVIKAFNKNMPYDQFVTWQLAGDLLPGASKEQILATAFHRNHAMTAEGGAIDEEFRLEYVFDRTNTTATAFMGLTMECARCHDHKFDPFSQEEYFKLTAFFNNVKEVGMTGDDGNYGPTLLMTDEITDQKIAELQKEIETQEKALVQTKEQIAASAKFISNLKMTKPVASFEFKSLREGKTKKLFPWEVSGAFVDGSSLGFIRGEAELIEGRGGKVLKCEDEYSNLFIRDAGLFELTDAYSAALWINTSKKDSSKTQVIMGTAGNKNNFWRGWDFYLDGENRLSVRLIHSLPHNYFHAKAAEVEIPLNTWTHIGFTYNGSGSAEGVQVYINGEAQRMTIPYDRLYKNIHPISVGAHERVEAPLLIGKSGRQFTGENGIFKGMMDEINLFRAELSAYEMARIAGLEPDARMEKEHLVHHAPALKKIKGTLKELRDEQLSLMDTVAEIMVMEEMPQPRPAFVLNRGVYSDPLYEVKPGTPQSVLSFAGDLPPNRLGLAQWLFNDENPLSARVAVNRYWQLFFGIGLVNTPQDFGNQGSLPTYPQLLDWLAVEFRTSGWDLKALCKIIVCSDTYRQNSAANEALVERDPNNELLARGPSYRLPAEMIRDNALATSGLLVQKIGGESVKPVQPEGLWFDLGNFSHKLLHYEPDSGDKLYRRSMYTFIRRTSPPPNMTTFDAPNRDICTVKREITNTPLQALVLLNDPQFVEASKAFAVRMQAEGGASLEEQLSFGFQLATSRRPGTEELRILKTLFEGEYARFQKDRQAVNALLDVGQYRVERAYHQTKTAALTIVANTLLNHDDAYMKR